MEKKRKIIPGVYLLITLAVMWLADYFVPIYRYISQPGAYGGIILVFMGIVILAVAANGFRKAGTGLLPFEEATTLVTSGLNRYSRNPMYVGMFLMVLGVAILFGSVGAFLPTLGFIWIIRNSFVLAEERFMEAAFGQSYREYKSKVRRWV